MVNGFPEDGQWLRCQLHCHTTRSDGTPEPAALAAHYAEAGFDVLAVTDHWQLTVPDDERLLIVPASELSARIAHHAEEAEVLAIGIETLPEPRVEFATLADCAAWVCAAGGVPLLAHPRWSYLAVADYLAAPALVGLEVFNGGCEAQQGSGLSDTLWDELLDGGARPVGIATDDAHDAGSPGGSDSLLGWTMVCVRERSRAAVLEALRSGACYGSSGPSIAAITVGPDGIEVSCSPASAVMLRSGPWDGGRVNADPRVADYRGVILARDADGLITRARLDPPEFCTWGRIEVLAADGGRAWAGALDLPGPRAPYR